MSLDIKFQNFKAKYDLNDEAMAEMLIIFNDSFIELAHKLLASNDKPVKKNESKKTGESKKWATKIAGEYAAENNLTLDSFEKEKITKKDIDEYLKNNSKKPVPKLITDVCTEIKNSKESCKEKSKEKCKEKCKGISKTGEPCNRPGTEKPELSKNFFCFRHAMDWKNYEVSSDSDDLEAEPEILRDPN
jgi:hypothetical protein